MTAHEDSDTVQYFKIALVLIQTFLKPMISFDSNSSIIKFKQTLTNAESKPRFVLKPNQFALIYRVPTNVQSATKAHSS